MYVQFLIEDESGKRLIDAIMEKHIAERPDDDIEYSALSYKGIGGFTKGQNARNTKSQQLLNDLPKRLKAFDTKLRQWNDAVLFIVLDNDTRNTAHFREQLNEIVRKEAIIIDHVFCIYQYT